MTVITVLAVALLAWFLISLPASVVLGYLVRTSERHSHTPSF